MKNVFDDPLLEQLDQALTEGRPPDAELLDKLANAGPKARDNFQQRLEVLLINKVRARSKKKDIHDMVSNTISQPLPRTRTRTRRGNTITLAAALLAVALLGAFLLMNFGGGDSLSVSFIRSAEEVNQDAFTLYIDEVWNQGNVALLHDVATDDVIYHDTTLPEDVVGIDGVSELVTNYRAAMLDFTYTIDAMSIDEDRVWAQLSASGTHTNTLELAGGVSIPASMNTATWSVTIISRFEDGKIAETWVQSGTLDLMQQLGVMPSLQEQTLEEENMEVVRGAIDLLHNHNEPTRAEMAEFYAQNYDFYGFENPVTINPVTGVQPPKFAGTVTWPDRVTTIENLFAEGDRVVAHVRTSGTFEGEMQPNLRDFIDPDFDDRNLGDRELPPTGELAEWNWILMYRLEDGKIVEEWWFWNHEFVAPHFPRDVE